MQVETPGAILQPPVPLKAVVEIEEKTAGRSPSNLKNSIPLTAALLTVAETKISFATPGHRGGRGFRVPLKLHSHVG